MVYRINDFIRSKNAEYTASLIDKEHIVEQAYRKGLYDFYNGNIVNGVKTVAANPYRKGTLYAQEWERGFNVGYFRVKEKMERRNGRV
jgi:hypothetical protein